MKIAIVHPSLATKGGAENVVMWLAEELSRRGHTVSLFTSDYDERFYGRRVDKAFSIVTLKLGGYDMAPWRFLVSGWRLRHVLAGFDWVNPHNFPAYIWAFLARLFNPRIGPIVWFCEEPVRMFYPKVTNRHLLELIARRPLDKHSFHTKVENVLRRGLGNALKVILDSFVGIPVAKWMDKLIVPRLDLVITNSRFIASHVEEIFGTHAVPCHLGIPIHRHTKIYPSHRLRGRYLLAVARLFPEKNIENILRAVAALSRQGGLPDFRLVIAGTGPLREDLEDLARKLDIEKIVKFKGFVSEEELAALYSCADAVVYLPLDETFGLVVLEAWRFKKIVIGPDHGGPSELIREGHNGFKADPLNPAEIARAIKKAIHSNRHLIGLSGYEMLREKYTIECFTDRFLRIVRYAHRT